MPRVRKIIDTTDHPVGQDTDVLMPPTGAPRLERASDFQEVDSKWRPNPVAESKIALTEVPKGVGDAYFKALAFDAEMVTIHVHESATKHEEPLVQVWVNGRHQLFPRGQDITCKRMFVERLARAKVTGYGNVEYVDAEGNRAMKYPTSTGLKYTFSVLRDDNPAGPAWLKKVLAEP